MYNIDEKQECANRCKKEFPNCGGFFLLNDGRCSCAKDDCSTLRNSTGYRSYQITGGSENNWNLNLKDSGKHPADMTALQVEGSASDGCMNTKTLKEAKRKCDKDYNCGGFWRYGPNSTEDNGVDGKRTCFKKFKSQLVYGSDKVPISYEYKLNKHIYSEGSNILDTNNKYLYHSDKIKFKGKDYTYDTDNLSYSQDMSSNKGFFYNKYNKKVFSNTHQANRRGFKHSKHVWDISAMWDKEGDFTVSKGDKIQFYVGGHWPGCAITVKNVKVKVNYDDGTSTDYAWNHTKRTGRGYSDNWRNIFEIDIGGDKTEILGGVSSFNVGAGIDLEVFEEKNFGGKSKKFQGPVLVNCLVGDKDGWDKNIKSVKIIQQIENISRDETKDINKVTDLLELPGQTLWHYVKKKNPDENKFGWSSRIYNCMKGGDNCGNDITDEGGSRYNALTFLSDERSLKPECVVATPNNYNYQKIGGDLTNRNNVVFSVDTKHDAIIALGPTIGHNDTHYEIVLGGWDNTKSVIRDKNQGTNITEYNEDLFQESGYVQGLMFTYYNCSNTNCTPSNPGTLIKSEIIDDQLYYNWGTGTILNSGRSDNVYVKANGFINVPSTGKYRFRAQTSDGITVKIDNKSIINKYYAQDPSFHESSEVSLEGGKLYPFNIDYFLKTSSVAMMRLFWSYPLAETETSYTANWNIPSYGKFTASGNKLTSTNRWHWRTVTLGDPITSGNHIAKFKIGSTSPHDTYIGIVFNNFKENDDSSGHHSLSGFQNRGAIGNGILGNRWGLGNSPPSGMGRYLKSGDIVTVKINMDDRILSILVNGIDAPINNTIPSNVSSVKFATSLIKQNQTVELMSLSKVSGYSDWEIVPSTVLFVKQDFPKTFWISWDRRIIRGRNQMILKVGKGIKLDEDEIMSADVSNTFYEIKNMLVSTGWGSTGVFKLLSGSCDPNELTKESANLLCNNPCYWYGVKGSGQTKKAFLDAGMCDCSNGDDPFGCNEQTGKCAKAINWDIVPTSGSINKKEKTTSLNVISESEYSELSLVSSNSTTEVDQSLTQLSSTSFTPNIRFIPPTETVTGNDPSYYSQAELNEQKDILEQSKEEQEKEQEDDMVDLSSIKPVVNNNIVSELKNDDIKKEPETQSSTYTPPPPPSTGTRTRPNRERETVYSIPEKKEGGSGIGTWIFIIIVVTMMLYFIYKK